MDGGETNIVLKDNSEEVSMYCANQSVTQSDNPNGESSANNIFPNAEDSTNPSSTHGQDSVNDVNENPKESSATKRSWKTGLKIALIGATAVAGGVCAVVAAPLVLPIAGVASGAAAVSGGVATGLLLQSAAVAGSAAGLSAAATAGVAGAGSLIGVGVGAGVAHAIHKHHEKTEKQQDQRPPASGRRCVVCLDEDKCILFLPCRHLCACTNCSEQLKQCPICKRDVTELVHKAYVFM